MEYVYGITDGCRYDCTDQEFKLIQIIKKLRDNFDNYKPPLCIVKGENDDYFLRAEDIWTLDGFADRFGRKASMLKYAREECAALTEHGVQASVDFDFNTDTMTVYADYSLTATSLDVNQFADVCERYYQEQLNKPKVTIVRDGKEIALTEEEVYAAYKEMEHKFNAMDVDARYDNDSNGDLTDKQFDRLVSLYENAKQHSELFGEAEELCFEVALRELRKEMEVNQ